MLRISRIGLVSLALLMMAAWAAPVLAAEGDTDLAAALREGQRHLMQKEPEAALADFRHAVELSDGKSSSAWLGVVNAQMELHQYGEAAESARQARSLAVLPEEQRAAVSQLLAALLLANRDPEAAEALRSYRAAGTTDGDVQLALCHAGQILAEREKKTANQRLRALDPAAPLLAGGDVQRPQVLEHAQPLYTRKARKARLQGTVILETVVGVDGRAGGIGVLKGLPMGLTENAIDAIKQWTFKPATLNGAPVPVCYSFTVNFEIQDSDQDKAGEAEPK